MWHPSVLRDHGFAPICWWQHSRPGQGFMRDQQFPIQYLSPLNTTDVVQGKEIDWHWHYCKSCQNKDLEILAPDLSSGFPLKDFSHNSPQGSRGLKSVFIPLDGLPYQANKFHLPKVYLNLKIEIFPVPKIFDKNSQPVIIKNFPFIIIVTIWILIHF